MTDEAVKTRTAETAEQDPKRSYFALHGVTVEIRETRCVRAARLHLAGIDPEIRVGAEVLYLGADREEGRRQAEAGRGDTDWKAGMTIAPDDDPYVYRAIGSPFDAAPDPARAWGLFREENGTLWTSYYSKAVLRDPEIYDKGLLFVFSVPRITAEKAPEITVFCEGKEIGKVTAGRAGAYSLLLDIRSCADPLLDYMSRTRRQQKVLCGEFVRVCEKYGLRAYLICGGLIGLLRDGMLLPWDDDLDVAVTREDYDKLLAAAETEWPEGGPFRLYTPSSLSGAFLDFMTRLVYTGETAPGDPFADLPDGGRFAAHFHLSLDIYILEEAAGGGVRHFLQTKEIQLLYALCLGHRPGFDPERRREKRRGRILAAKILAAAGRRIPLDRLLSRYGRVCARYRGKGGTAYFQSNGYYACIPMRFEKEWFGKGHEILTGGMRFTVPEDGDAFLRTMYGDYRKYPGVGDRRPQHQSGGSGEKRGES